MLKDQILIAAVWTDAAVRLTNDTGTPVDSEVGNGDGRALADVYVLDFSAVTAGVSADVTVGTSSPNNPYGGETHTVNLDGVTEYKDVIPGVTLIFNDDVGFLNTWQATVNLGEFLGTFDAFGGGAGVPSAGVRHRVLNDGTGAVSDAKATLLPIAKWVKMIGGVFDTVRNFADGATEKQAGGGSSQVVPYVITVDTVAGAGALKTCTVKVDGVTFPAASLRDLSTGVAQSGALVKAVSPGHFYQVILGDLTGLEFAIHEDVADGDEANVLIFESRFVQIAPDVAGVAGAYGTADITLTQSGEAAGVIQPAGTAFFWRRVLVPAGGNAESNPYPGDVALKGTETGAAGWLD
jgi:hypothetical protein